MVRLRLLFCLIVLPGVAFGQRPDSLRAAGTLEVPDSLKFVNTAADAYVPSRFDWATVTPIAAGFEAARLDSAIAFAQASESQAPRDLSQYVALSFAREPYDAIVGPTAPRGPMSGMVIRGGRIVAEWGDTEAVEMTFSVTKTFLSTVVGLAWDAGLIEDVADPVRRYTPDSLFATPHNAQITWDHLLRQTSFWQGTLWGKPDWADRPPRDRQAFEWPTLDVPAPGTDWKYNDVRVNLLALAALHVWREPLPDVLREQVMDPIGASNTWRWEGYENSWITLDGQYVQSVSGGGHWGGGMFISARDLGRLGLFALRRGTWGGERLLDETWFDMATTPTEANRGYGYMNYFLNTDGEAVPGAPEEAYYFAGSGSNIVYVDPVHDLVVVVRWIQGQRLDEFLVRVIDALEE